VILNDQNEKGLKKLRNGWQSIDVFVGPTRNLSVSLRVHGHDVRRTDSPLYPCGTADGSRVPHLWFSQASQDEIILAMLGATSHKNATGIFRGFFVDLASNHAVQLSNTYVLEKKYHWRGLCIEANPSYWHDLSMLRPRCRIIGAVVGNHLHPQEKVQFYFKGGIARQGFDNGIDAQAMSEIA
jgi:hypothetical protein